ncbi:MAG: hypothetical protein OXE84_10735 [Rhodobacteraceae bacterium]|nr:hypothetical protein [Paracoccaceae bacterium]MCY4195559.1 hypothetical protein [Paracoccaceae bacterium]
MTKFNKKRVQKRLGITALTEAGVAGWEPLLGLPLGSHQAAMPQLPLCHPRWRAH